MLPCFRYLISIPVKLALASFIIFSSTHLNAEGIVVKAADKVFLESISSHKQNYVFPATYRNHQGNYQQSEMIFQFSAKKMVFFENLYIAYTQETFWQFMDTENSRPMRETNYNPEIFYDLPPGSFEFNQGGVRIGTEHESNGQGSLASRSWNRAYLWPYWSTKSSEYSIKIWVRYPEDEKKFPADPKGDDNPDIHKYLGYGEFYFFHARKKQQYLSGMLRGNTATGKGAIQLDYTWPLSMKDTYFITRIFSGYGESLIDYNQSVDRISLGFTFK